jgi:hypothetical protein
MRELTKKQVLRANKDQAKKADDMHLNRSNTPAFAVKVPKAMRHS